MPVITPGNMFSRGKWEFCKEYDPGDVVERAGAFFLCINGCAGYDPLDTISENFWRALGGEGGGGGEVTSIKMLWSTHTMLSEANVANRYFDLPVGDPDIAPSGESAVVVMVQTDTQHVANPL